MIRFRKTNDSFVWVIRLLVLRGWQPR